MTRPETLVRQLADHYLQPLLAEDRKVRATRFPAPKVTPTVRRLHREYQTATRRAEALRQRLVKAGGSHHYPRPRMIDNGRAQAAVLAALATRLEKIRALKQTAMLGVLGLDAAKARPIVLKLKKDLERLGK